MKRIGALLLALGIASLASARDLKVVWVEVSSTESHRPELRGDNAVDGIPLTRWSSEFSDPQWIRLDLGAPKTFSRVTIEWEAAFAREYDVQASDDGIAWTTLRSVKDGDGGQDVVGFKPVNHRYVRVFCRQRGTPYGVSICELRVSDEPVGVQAPPAPPAGLTAAASEAAVFLSWTPGAEGTRYNVYRSGSLLGHSSAPEFTDDTAKPGQPYAYHVTAVGPGGESKRSESVRGTRSEAARRDVYAIPACAWRHALGDIPKSCISSSPDRGVAIGGFGAGSFMYTISGSFGPFQTLDSTLYKGEWLDGAAFHFYEKVGDAPPTAKCLATDVRTKAAWDRLNVGEGTYFALQPKGWVTYSAFKTDVSQKFFTPILTNNYRETSYPVGAWVFRVHNPTTNKAEVAVMLTFPDVYVGEQLSESAWTNETAADGFIRGVVMRSRHGLGEWCIAANGAVSVAPSWNGGGDGADIRGAFADDGVLPKRPLDASQSAAAIAVRVQLEPGATKEIPFAIAWDFPVVKFNSGTEWWKKYTEYFGRAGTNAFAIASAALKHRAGWEAALDEWMRPVLESDAYPDWLKCAAFNELYYDQFGGVFYEAGLKSGHTNEFMGLHPEDHKHYVMESPVYTSANTLDVRHYASVEFARFWPEIERDTLKVFADGALHYQGFKKPVPVGLVPHDVGDPKKCDPFFDFDVYRHDLPDMLFWKDLSSKFVQQCWRYWKLTGDRATLEYTWPACKAVYAFMASTDADGDQLPDNAGSDNTYDAWGLYGTSLLCGGLWVGALEGLEQMAAELNDPSLGDIRACLGAARTNLDAELWRPDKGCYRMDTKGKYPNAIMSDGLNGELFCRRYGLADILPADRMASHLRKTYELCVKPFGDRGAINAVNEDGSLLGTLQSDEVWTGSSYFLAALMADAGLTNEALKTAYGVYYNTYVNRDTAFWFNTPESWRIPTMIARPNNPEQYQRPRAVWELLLAIKDPYK